MDIEHPQICRYKRYCDKPKLCVSADMNVNTSACTIVLTVSGRDRCLTMCFVHAHHPLNQVIVIDTTMEGWREDNERRPQNRKSIEFYTIFVSILLLFFNIIPSFQHHSKMSTIFKLQVPREYICRIRFSCLLFLFMRNLQRRQNHQQIGLGKFRINLMRVNIEQSSLTSTKTLRYIDANGH